MNPLTDPNITVFLSLFAAVVLSAYRMRRGGPLTIIACRWILWVSVSLGIAMALRVMDLSGKPLWALTVFCLLFWVLADMVYNWLAIDAVSRSGMPLFPTFKACGKGSQWPVDKSFSKLRDEVRGHSYKHLASAVGQFEGEDFMRCSVYEDEDHAHRLEMLFVPRSSGRLQVFFSFTTLLEDGRRLVTDNVFTPFGGFFPEHVHLERRPMWRSLTRLKALHEARTRDAGSRIVHWEGDPVQDLNVSHRELEQLNTSLGYLVEPSLREEYGSISREGRFRLWSELLMLNYLGKANKYC